MQQDETSSEDWPSSGPLPLELTEAGKEAVAWAEFLVRYWNGE